MSNREKKIYGSSAAFAWGRVVFTNSKAGCIRAIMLQSRGVREKDIPEKYKEMGAHNEARYEEVLKNAAIPYDRELPVRYQVPGIDDVFVSGRVDFVERGTVTKVVELKSTDSSGKASEVITKGRWVPENLAQLVGYMIALQAPDGMLIYTYYSRDKKTSKLVLKKERAFTVILDDAGRVCVDGVPSGYSVYDQLQHSKNAAEAVSTGEVWDRPYGAKAGFKSPCKFCPFSSTCDAYDAGDIQGSQAFLEMARKALDDKTVSERKESNEQFEHAKV